MDLFLEGVVLLFDIIELAFLLIEDGFNPLHILLQLLELLGGRIHQPLVDALKFLPR